MLQAKAALGTDFVDEGQVEKTTSAFARLRQLKNDLANADPNDHSTIQRLLEEAGQLESRLGDVRQQVKLLGSTTAGIDATIQGIQGLIGAWGALQGAMALVNDDNKELAETTKDLTAVLAFLDGVQQVAMVLDKNSALNLFLQAQYRKLAAGSAAQQATATGAVVAAQTAEAISARAAATSTLSLNAAMSANPAAILLLAITSIIAAYDAFTDGAEEESFKNKYSNTLPPSWMALEITSFGTLSMLFTGLRSGIAPKKAIAHFFGLDDKTFPSWLHTFVYIRNVCAHHSRLWNKEMQVTPKIPHTPKNTWLTNTSVANNKTYYILSMILYLLQTIDSKNQMIFRLMILCKKYPNIDLMAMGFPFDWQREPLWNLKPSLRQRIRIFFTFKVK